MNTVVNHKNFKEQVMQKRGLNIVQFFAEWSGTCQMMIPVYDELSKSYSSRANFYSVNVDEEPTLKEQYGIMELPTVLFFSNGSLVDALTGAVSKNAFITKLENTAAKLNSETKFLNQ